uniref:Vitellogenin domain-containing protein n=1 Tax=Gouania willdenowi TaxID=441366 RepID=A0A8C5DVG6_GOUWI
MGGCRGWFIKLNSVSAVASRFKAHKKYVYQYTTKSQNGVVGISDMSNGPKVSCQVEMEVPQPCEFVLHVRDCALSDETDRDPQDPSETDAFKAVMERNPLKFSVEEVSGVQLYPEPDESVNILNIKRGIISALLVPLLEDDQSRLMSTVHGKCLTKHLVKARMDTPTEVTLTRDLSRCDQFYGRELTNSPLALMQNPLSKLITSAQSCSYQFDNKGKHITAALCTEKHSYLPFSYQDNGLSSIVTQELTLQSTKRINNRIFDVNPSLKKPLYFEDPDDKAPVQDKEAVLSTMQELLALAGTDQGQKRTSLFHKLVSSMRVLKNETLSQTVTEMFKKSGWLTMQALFQCGSSECTSGILQIIRSIDGVSLEVDALIYVLSLQGNPDEAHVRDMLNMAQYKQMEMAMMEVYFLVMKVSFFFFFFLNLCFTKHDVNPNLISTIAACAKKPELSLSNQKAALQSFRLMDINDEIRNTLMEVYKAKQSPVEKRAAAYLILTKKPDLPLIKDIVNNLENERDDQFRSFVRSHLNNILNSEEPQMNLLKDYIKEAFKDGSLSNQIFHEMSLNYKANSPLGSIESNILFDGVDSLPKEMTLGSTLKLFEEDFDLFEVRLHPNHLSRQHIHRTLCTLVISFQAPQDLLKDITEALRTLREKVEMSASPEATAYLRLLGKEIGYMKSTEMRKALETFSIFNFASVSTPKALHALTSNTENEVFGHYIFMENSFSLPTASGFPLKYSLAGVLAPGAKGGLAPSAMPSVGLEFITRMGVYIPEYVDAGIEMHTNMFHQSSLNAKITMKRNQFKIVLPAPTSNVQLVTVSNELISISSCQKTLVPSSAEKRSESTDCQPLFRGLNLCTVMQYPNATTRDQAPYLPLTGQSKFAVEIHPTGKVSEYSASFTDETLREGKKGRHRVDNLKLTLRAEGTATITLKYNRNKQTVSSELIIPDCDIEAGIKLAVTDSDVDGTKIRGINIDVTNKNIPQLSLVGRARLEKMRDSMLQLQVLMPYLNSDASVTANLRKDEDMHMNLETVIHLPDMFYEQKTSVKYDNDKFEVELKSDFNSEIQKMIPNLEEHHKQLQDLIDNFFLFHLFSDSLFRYQFNKDKIAISIPFPHGGKKSEELNIPKRLSVPEVDIPEIGLRIPANSYPLPTFTIPPSLDFTVPLLGLAEASTKINSNFYSWEGIISGGNTTVDVPSYTALYKAMAQSPFCLLSYKLEGSGIISGIPDTGLIYLLNNSFNHCLIDTSFSYGEALRVTDKMNARANYKFEAASPLGLQASLHSSSQAMSTLNSDDVTGDGTMDGFLKVGSLNTTISYTNSYQLRPLEQTGRGKSTFQFNAPFLRIDNTIEALYENNELKIVSKTNAQKDAIKHVAEFKYKDAKLTLKSNAVATAMDKTISNKAELGISGDMAIFRFETQAEDDKNRAYSLLRALLDSNGLEANSEGTLMFTTGRGLHKATVKISEYGLSTSGTNSIQCSPVTLENIFDGTIDSNGAIFSSTIKIKTENSHTLTLTLWTLKLRSKTNNIICEDVYYKHDAKVDMKPFVVGLDVKNDLRIYDFILNNEDHLKFEPQKADLSGMVSAALGDQHNLKQSYEVIYNDMAATMKSAMSGNIMDSQLSHKCEVEIAGLSLTSSCEGRVTSEHLRMDGNIRTMALPFSLSIDALLNSDGELHLNGKHTGQLYSRFLVKAEPLAFSLTQDCRISTVHKLPNGESSTDLDSKFENLLTPNDQSLAWKVKSNLNEHTYLKDLSVANDKEKMLLEFSDVLTSNIISRLKGSPPEMQEFRTSGFFRYDKNSDCRIIEIPFIQSFPAAFEQLKNTLVKALESLKQSIVNLDIDQQINDFRDNIDRIPSEVSDFMQKLDLENKVKQVKAKLDYLINEFGITMEDLELGVNRLREDVEKSLVVLFTTIKDFLSNLEVYIRDGHFADKTMSILSNIEHQVHSWDKKYEIQQTVIKILDAIEDIIKQIDLQKLRDRSATFLRELDAKYEILDTIKSKLSDLKQAIKKFDLGSFLQDLKDYFLSPDWASFVAQLKDQIPTTEIAKVMESMNDVIVNWIDEYEIPIKLNAVYAYLRDLFLKYNLDDTIKDIMDQSVILLKEFKISETIQSVVDAVKAIRFEQFRDLFMQCLYSVTNQLRDMDYRKIINGVNENISSMLKLMKEFDYDTFVDEINRKIAQVTGYVNKQIKAYEIVEKLEAVRDYFREIQSSIVTYLEELRNTKVADALKKLKNVIDSAFFNDVKLKVQDMLEDMRQRISDMDIRDELYKYLQRTSESYSNIVAFISVQFDRLMEKIRHIVEDNEVFTQVKEAVDGVLDRMRRAEIKMPSFTLPLTDLEVPAFKINLNKLQEISIPAQISIPEFTILNSYTIPAFTGDFEEIKSKLVEIIDNMQAFELQTPNLEEIFGDLKVIYFSDLPDFTFPEITLSEIKVPVITIPKLNLKDFDIMMLSIPEIKFPGFPSDICVPVFGKLHGDFHINFPHYTLVTTWIFENITSSIKNPQLTATLTSEAKSSFEPLEYTFHAYAKLEAPRLKKLLFTEKVKARNKAFIIDHEGLLTLTGPSIQVSTKIEAKATAPLYTADLINNMALTIGEGITAATDTTYNHNLDVPAIETLSQTSMKHDAVATIAPGKITVTSDTNGNGKWSIQDYSDEGTHKNSLKFDVSSSIAKLIFTEETDSKAFKSKKSLNAEAVTLSHMTVEARCETELPFVKKSVMALNGEAHIGDLKVALTASHDAEFTGSLAGSMSNWLEFRAYPFEIFLDVKNKKNSKIFFPLRLVGKVDFLHDYGIVINSEKQLAFCQALARFNQYKYTHDFKVENNQMSITLQALANGEANLDFLTVPLTIPEITLPHIEITIPEVRDFSLWENAGLKNLFTTPQQSFDMNLRLQYNKNPDTHSFDLHLEPFYSALSDNLNILQAQFEAGRDKSDIVARFVGSSVSVFDILNGKIDGTTSLTKKSGLKLATTVSLEHTNIEANHECAMSLTKRNMEASVTNDVKINLPFLNLEFNDELKGNTKTKPNLSSKTKLKYMFNIPMIASVGKGNLDSNCELEGLSSYLSFETFTQGKTDISIMDRYNFAGDLENVGSFYLNANGLRSTLKTVLNANTDKQEKEKRRAINIFLFNLNENLALEVSLRRVFAKFDHMSNNRVDFGYINTDGKYIVSSFAFPKSLTLGEYTVDLNEITNHISNFELPSIVIPEQKIEIPEFDLIMPLSVFVPNFGGLSAKLKVSSPIYNISTTANLEKSNSNFVTSLNSVCTSTIIFLEYDLTGKIQIILLESLHTLNIDITSPTFIDANFRFASRKDGITASVSSPSSGFLGLNFLRRSPSHFHGKLFSRYLSSPDKDVDVLTLKATLKNSEKLALQTLWNWEFFHDVIEGVKEKIPAVTNAVIKFLNKYHNYHFGFDLNRGGTKIKNTMSNFIERAYHKVPVSLEAVHDAVQNICHDGKAFYTQFHDSLMSMDVNDTMDNLLHEMKKLGRHSEAKVQDLMDWVTQFLGDTKFPESEVSLLDVVQQVHNSVSRAFTSVLERLEHLFMMIEKSIRNTEFMLPGSNTVVKGGELMDELTTSFRLTMRKMFKWADKTAQDIFQVTVEKAKDFLTFLKDQNWDIAQLEEACKNILDFLKQQMEEATRFVSENKNLIRTQIEEAYAAFSMERVVNFVYDFISNLQLQLYAGLEMFAEQIRKASQSTSPYIKVGNKKLDVEVPLPFFWKSFSEWPTYVRH